MRAKNSAAAVAKNHMSCFNYIYNHGFPINHLTAVEAARCGNLPALIKVYQATGIIKGAASVAIMNCRLKCAIYAISVGDTFKENSVRFGCRLLSCIKFAHESGESLHHEILRNAIFGGQVRVLQYCNRHNAIFPIYLMRDAIIYAQVECLRFLVNHTHIDVQEAFQNARVRMLENEMHSGALDKSKYRAIRICCGKIKNFNLRPLSVVLSDKFGVFKGMVSNITNRVGQKPKDATFKSKNAVTRFSGFQNLDPGNQQHPVAQSTKQQEPWFIE
jgi:hypothetical protein